MSCVLFTFLMESSAVDIGSIFLKQINNRTYEKIKF